jgi:epoxyqueuosine reductase
MKNIKDEIIKKSIELGISDIKFTSIEIDQAAITHYKHWIDSKFHSSMHYLENNFEKRTNVQLILEQAKTVIVCALNYYPGDYSTNNKDFGKVSRYAQGKDYHIVFKNKITLLAEFLQEISPNSNSKVYVDTGAIFERYFAEKAGIGWQGKNGNIISPKIGSYFFIGIIITTAEFEIDLPIKNHCGKCNLCLQSCPTQAIVSPKIIDSNKCIAFWTIEAKPYQEIPPTIADKNQDWLFGCDICQEVCPWNKKFAQVTQIQDFINPNNSLISLTDIIQMEQEEFSLKFKDSPIKRTKLEGLKRNASALIHSKNSKT